MFPHVKIPNLSFHRQRPFSQVSQYLQVPGTESSYPWVVIIQPTTVGVSVRALAYKQQELTLVALEEQESVAGRYWKLTTGDLKFSYLSYAIIT